MEYLRFRELPAGEGRGSVVGVVWKGYDKYIGTCLICRLIITHIVHVYTHLYEFGE